MKLSVIIVAYNNAATIRDCLDSVFDDPPSFPFEVFVVDNASTDKTLKVVEDFPQVTLIKNRQNLGFARANNQAIKRSTGDYILLLNADAQTKPGSVEKIASFMGSNKKVGVIGPKLLSPARGEAGLSGEIQREVTRFPTLAPMIAWLLRLQKIPFLKRIWPLSSYLCAGFDYDEVQEADHLMGSALMVRRKVFDEVGLFDEEFFFWFEETDLCKRVKEAGWKIVYYPEAEVVHHVGSSTRRLGPFAIQQMWNRSLVAYFKKHGRPWEVWVLRLFFPFSYLAAVFAWTVKRLMSNA
jgi:GT2 family glycosyltransferase